MDRSILRIMDANFNRAREALRVMEEYARFALNDETLCRTIKEARHALSANLAMVPGDRSDTNRTTGHAELPEFRDIVHDVGRETTAPAEGKRDDAHHVVKAACKRLSEALRALEEYGKLASGTLGEAMKKLRYDGYEIERRLIFSVRAQERFGSARLYVILTAALCRHDWLVTAKLTLDGGADVLQLREKDLSDRELMNRASQLSSLCHERGILFIVDDRPDVAVLSGADGVHVGRDDLSVSDVRRIVPGSMIVGTSTHTIEQVDVACQQTPDYVAVGPMFHSATKPQDHIAGLGTLRAARARTALPLVAIGGIGAENAADVLARGADCLCLCSAIVSHADVTSATKRFRDLIDAHFHAGV